MSNSLQDLDRKLGYLGRQALPAAKAAVLAGARVIAARAKLEAASYIQSHIPAYVTEGSGKPKRKRPRKLTGNLIRSIKARAAKVSGKIAGAKAGLDVGSRDFDKKAGVSKLGPDGNRGSHGHLYVSGTVQRTTGWVRVRKRGKTVGRRRTGNPEMNRGISPPHGPSFIKTAAANSVSEMDAAIKTKLIQGLDKALGQL